MKFSIDDECVCYAARRAAACNVQVRLAPVGDSLRPQSLSAYIACLENQFSVVALGPLIHTGNGKEREHTRGERTAVFFFCWISNARTHSWSLSCTQYEVKTETLAVTYFWNQFHLSSTMVPIIGIRFYIARKLYYSERIR